MRRSSDPEVRRNASMAVSIESLDETSARDAITVNRDGVQQIVATPSPSGANGQLERNSKSVQSLRSIGDSGAGVVAGGPGNGHLLNNGSLKSLRGSVEGEMGGKDAVELTPLTGSASPASATVRSLNCSKLNLLLCFCAFHFVLNSCLSGRCLILLKIIQPRIL